jgi:hypothetical protein
MPTIHITDETMAAIRWAAIYDFNQTGRRQPGGSWLIDIDAEVPARLEAATLPGETTDDTVQRIIRQHLGDRPN